MEGLEPLCLAALDPKSSASTISPHPLKLLANLEINYLYEN